MPDGAEQTIEIKEVSPYTYTEEFQVEEEGIYKISFVPGSTSEVFQDLNKSETIFMAEPPQSEVRGPTANSELLKTISENTGGKYITTDTSPVSLKLDTSRKKILTGYETKKLWDNTFVFLLLIGLLSSEWLLRRRWGLK